MDDKKDYTVSEKMEIASLTIDNNMTAEEVGKKYGITGTTVMNWRKKYLPEAITIEDLSEMSIREIDKASERDSTILRRFALQRIMVLVPKEKDIDKLTRLIKELKSIDEEVDPGKKTGPWSIQVHQAIQNITNNITNK